MVLREILYLNIYFRTMRWSYIVIVLRKLNKDEFSGLLISGFIGKLINIIFLAFLFTFKIKKFFNCLKKLFTF